MACRVLVIILVLFWSPREFAGENTVPGTDQEAVEKLKRTQRFLTELHDSMHRIQNEPDEKERERLKAEQLKLLQIHMISHGAGANQEHIQGIIQRSIDSQKEK